MGRIGNAVQHLGEGRFTSKPDRCNLGESDFQRIVMLHKKTYQGLHRQFIVESIFFVAGNPRFHLFKRVGWFGMIH